jgi:hypothetical protein
VEAREMEIKMIKALRPKFNMTGNGELKKTGYNQRTEPFSELKKMLRQGIREELKSANSHVAGYRLADLLMRIVGNSGTAITRDEIERRLGDQQESSSVNSQAPPPIFVFNK